LQKRSESKSAVKCKAGFRGKETRATTCRRINKSLTGAFDKNLVTGKEKQACASRKVRIRLRREIEADNISQIGSEQGTVVAIRGGVHRKFENGEGEDPKRDEISGACQKRGRVEGGDLETIAQAGKRLRKVKHREVRVHR